MFCWLVVCGGVCLIVCVCVSGVRVRGILFVCVCLCAGGVLAARVLVCVVGLFPLCVRLCVSVCLCVGGCELVWLCVVVV